MASAFFPDNTVLVNFGIINRFDLLAELIGDNGVWCETVATECSMSTPHHPAMAQAHAIFGDPLKPDPREMSDAQILRKQMLKPGDRADPYVHLGEAETITIAVQRGLSTSAYFITDDGDAAIHAKAAHMKVVTTWDLFRLARRARPQMFDDNEVWRCVLALNRAGRVHPPCPSISQGHRTFLNWLA